MASLSTKVASGLPCKATRFYRSGKLGKTGHICVTSPKHVHHTAHAACPTTELIWEAEHALQQNPTVCKLQAGMLRLVAPKQSSLCGDVHV
jgi:hypothetical protein